MIIVKDNDVVKKYKFEVDKEKLEKLKYEIIVNCSIIRHKKERIDDRFTLRYAYEDKSKYIINYNIKEVEKVITELNATQKDFGKVMKELTTRLKNKTDGKTISNIVKDKLK